jgi:hypothetical protein
VGLAESASSAKWLENPRICSNMYGEKKVLLAYYSQDIGEIRICGFQGFKV